MIFNENNDFIRYRRPQQIISLIRNEIFVTLSHETEMISKAKHLDKLEKLIEQFRINLCGNFYRQPWKENRNDFQLEREFISQHMLGYFIFNMDRFERRIIAENYVKIFVHIITKYAYGTRRPFLEKLENKSPLLLKRLLHFLATDPDNSIFAAKILIETFNKIFSNDKVNYYVRLSMIKLFGQLIQNRYLQKLIQTYTISLDNFHLIYGLMKNAEKQNRDIEFTKLFEIIRLFIMNPVNTETNNPMRKVFIDEYNLLTKFIGKAQRIRSYTDIALFTPEYSDVMDRLNRISNPDLKQEEETFGSELSLSSLI
ncbi:hypothetical protein BLA29_003949 [Euroglyphus maynei]|uniref:Uncharacterized protein n=1 Tax=Euroglyphus maynei TaxID=6958 RepID=A0A1Y3ASS9_EURMA|nr:hypothetical protein BLA29_003949 [Euroglyphus maynei]